MRVAVSGKAGKEGSGKTTLSGVLARLAGRWFGRALAIDGDPNPNLARALGIPHEGPWQLPPPDLLEAVEAEGGRKVRLTRSVEEILTTYGVDGPDGVKLLALGEVEAPGKGCIGLTGWMGLARVLRAELVSLRERDFVLAARALGVGGIRLALRHLLPNALPPVLALLGHNLALALTLFALSLVADALHRSTAPKLRPQVLKGVKG